MAKVLPVPVTFFGILALLCGIVVIPSGPNYVVKFDNTNLNPVGVYYHELEKHNITADVSNLTLEDTTLGQYLYIYQWGYQWQYANGTSATVHKNAKVSRIYNEASTELRYKNGSTLLELQPGPRTWLDFPFKAFCQDLDFGHLSVCRDESVLDRLSPATGLHNGIAKARFAMVLLLFFISATLQLSEGIWGPSAAADKLLKVVLLLGLAAWITSCGLSIASTTTGRPQIKAVVHEFRDHYAQYGIIATTPENKSFSHIDTAITVLITTGFGALVGFVVVVSRPR